MTATFHIVLRKEWLQNLLRPHKAFSSLSQYFQALSVTTRFSIIYRLGKAAQTLKPDDRLLCVAEACLLSIPLRTLFSVVYSMSLLVDDADLLRYH